MQNPLQYNCACKPEIVLSQANTKEERCKRATCCSTGAHHNVIRGQLFWSRQPKVAGLFIIDALRPHISLHLLMHAVARTYKTYINRP